MSGEPRTHGLPRRLSLGPSISTVMEMLADSPIEASSHDDIIGMADQPRLKAPSIEEIAKGAIDKGLGGLLDKFKKKK